MNNIKDYYISEFNPRAYLKQYFSKMDNENLAFSRFFVRAFQDVPADGIMLDFGCGPTIYSWITAATKVSEIHIADYLSNNLREVEKWLQNSSDAWDWSLYIKTAMEFEGIPDCSDEAIEQRAADIRQRVTKIMHCDARLPQPLGETQQTYDILLACFCTAEAAGGDYKMWREILGNITSLLKPGGKLIFTTVCNSTSYSVLGKEFPITSVSESQLRQALEELGFDTTSFVIEDVPPEPGMSYEGLLLLFGTKLP